jgi:hypothetical protein
MSRDSLTHLVSFWQSGAVRLPNRIPAVWLVVIGIVSLQFGAAVARICSP